ncbi:hypothetical protein HWV62_221 [Athelia sp. TMB]|nr:hypothetical protein HWV62_221 [Athelia sp. TMB]
MGVALLRRLQPVTEDTLAFTFTASTCTVASNTPQKISLYSSTRASIIAACQERPAAPAIEMREKALGFGAAEMDIWIRTETPTLTLFPCSGGFKDVLAHGHNSARAARIFVDVTQHGPAQCKRQRRRHGHHHPHEGPAAPTVKSTGLGTAARTRAAVGVTAASVDATNSGMTYTLAVGAGEPAPQYTLICTGSFKTWIGASTRYTPTSTLQSAGDKVIAPCGSGSSGGTEYTAHSHSRL